MDFIDDHKHKDLRDLHKQLIILIENFRAGSQYADDVTLLSCQVM
jgi:serine phosphatase RsbU (regulator of sigma subunit)